MKTSMNQMFQNIIVNQFFQNSRKALSQVTLIQNTKNGVQNQG